MLIVKKIIDLQNAIKNHPIVEIGFIPTMGALHLGHISLVKRSKEENGLTICSIFINPTQFNDSNDFSKYPITIETDIELLDKAGCDILFLPSVAEIYPDGTESGKKYELGELEKVFEGEFRPGHFQGVCQVMDRLLKITDPTKLYLGQKDYQQTKVMGKLIELKNFECAVKICPTQRALNGLAMSSRNVRLSIQAKEKASAIFVSLNYCKDNYLKESPGNLKNGGTAFLIENGFEIEYFEVVDADSLRKITNWNENQSVVVLVAAFIEGVRLIDNMILH